MSGKIIGVLIVSIALIAGVAMYYLQVYGFYEEVAADNAQVELTNLATGAPEPIVFDGFRAIDADSSPIRYRACFTTPLSLPMLTETFELYEGAEPRNAPGWFGCFDAAAIGAEIAAGNALVFTGQRNIEYGIDRVVAITGDGRGFVWHEVNDCGDKLYDGSPKSTNCPDRQEGQN